MRGGGRKSIEQREREPVVPLRQGRGPTVIESRRARPADRQRLNGEVGRIKPVVGRAIDPQLEGLAEIRVQHVIFDRHPVRVEG